MFGSAWLASQTGCLAQDRVARPEYRMIAERLVRSAKERRALRSIGIAYLSSLNERPSLEAIAAGWFPTPTDRARALTQTPRELFERVAARARDDYRLDRVVNVRGWLLSETEARFAVLTALSRRV